MKHYYFLMGLMALVECLPRFFIKAYKYHEIGMKLEFLHIIIISVVITVYANLKITDTPIFRYLKVLGFSLIGYLMAYVFLFSHWYITYELAYASWREGIQWNILFYLIGSISILISSLITQFVFVGFKKIKRTA